MTENSKTPNDFDEGTFWAKVRRNLGKVPFMDDVLAAYYCAMDPATPTRVRGVILAALAYFVLPTDLVPDVIVGFGFTDDATVLATAMGIISGHIREPHRIAANRFLEKETV